MIEHQQVSDHLKVFYEPQITESGESLTIPAGSVWVHGTEYPLSAYTPVIGTGVFRLFVERTSTGADYLLYLTLFDEPVSFGEGIGALSVAWREFPGDDLHVLRHVAA